LGDVGLNVVRAIENDADGAWGGLNNLIRIAFNADKPIKTMRHEALHALKELGFFTPQQWEALKREAEEDLGKQIPQECSVQRHHVSLTTLCQRLYKEMGWLPLSP
jgi:hypothetical protein